MLRSAFRAKEAILIGKAGNVKQFQFFGNIISIIRIKFMKRFPVGRFENR